MPATRPLDVTRTATTAGTSNKPVPPADIAVGFDTYTTTRADTGGSVIGTRVRFADGREATFVVDHADLAARFAGQMIDGSVRLRSAQEIDRA